MLKNTFIHAEGIGERTEQRLWEAGILGWSHVKGKANPCVSAAKWDLLRDVVAESKQHLKKRDCAFFAERLPAREHWRLLGDFRRRAAYVDIETTGLDSSYDHITTIALYDGRRTRTYIHGQNLQEFRKDILGFDLLVTYNGRCFDAPFLQRSLRATLPAAHVDLRFLLQGLGYGGGLKGCERRLKVSRPAGLVDIDGFMAVHLWHAHTRGRRGALDTLLAYNVEDVLSLEQLAIIAYNEKLSSTPFDGRLQIRPKARGANKYRANRRLIEELGTRCW